MTVSKEFKNIIKEISQHASKGRLILEAPEEEEDPLAPEEDPLAGGEDPLAGGEDPLGGMGEDPLGGDMGMEDDPEAQKDQAEADKLKSQADAEEANADAAKAKADKEKSEAEREKAEAESGEFNGIQLFSRPGTAFLIGQLLDDYSQENKLDQLAQQFIAKLKMDDEGLQRFKADSGPLLKLQGFQQLVNSMEDILQTSTEDDVEDATEMNEDMSLKALLNRK
jgi:hypothetical protein